MPTILVTCCKKCKWILEEDWFYRYRNRDGSLNRNQGRCPWCGSTEFTEGEMSVRDQLRFDRGEFRPVISQIGGQRIEDPFKELAPKHFFIGEVHNGRRQWRRMSVKEAVKAGSGNP